MLSLWPAQFWQQGRVLEQSVSATTAGVGLQGARGRGSEPRAVALVHQLQVLEDSVLEVERLGVPMVQQSQLRSQTGSRVVR